MHIRPATPDDADAISAIYNDAIANTTAVLWHEPKPVGYWREQLTDRPPLYPALVAEDAADDAILGFTALFRYDTKCGYDDIAEWSLYVHADARGKGVGMALSQAIIEAGRSAGLHSIVARVTADNTASIALQDKLGLRRVGTLEQVGNKFGKRHDVLIYQLVL